MALPRPESGLVIRYSFLWSHEAERGQVEGSKDRPCAVVLAVADQDGTPRVIVLPITHSPPIDQSLAIAVPAAVKRRLGLDSDQSWIALTEANEFRWPGPDIRPKPGARGFDVTYGFLPRELFLEVRAGYVAAVRARRAQLTSRTE